MAEVLHDLAFYNPSHLLSKRSSSPSTHHHVEGFAFPRRRARSRQYISDAAYGSSLQAMYWILCHPGAIEEKNKRLAIVGKSWPAASKEVIYEKTFHHYD
jgi:hypothetical protein